MGTTIGPTLQIRNCSTKKLNGLLKFRKLVGNRESVLCHYNKIPDVGNFTKKEALFGLVILVAGSSREYGIG